MSDFTIAVTHPRCHYGLSTDQPKVHPSSVYLAENTIVIKALFCGHPSFYRVIDLSSLITDIPENDTYGWNSLWTSCISSKLCQHFVALHSHTTSQHCQSWGAACVNTFQVCSWPSIRRTVLLLTLTQEALLVEISGSASHGAPKTSGKITIARMGVLRS